MNTKLLIGGVVVLAGALTIFLLTRNDAAAPVGEGEETPASTPAAPAAPPAVQLEESSQTEEAARSEEGAQTGTEEAASAVRADTGGDETSTAAPAAAPSEKVFTVTGRNFAFSLQEIRVKKGDTVTINFSSVEGFHDFTIDEFNARTERVQAGQSSSVTFVADKAGTFEYYCSVGSHRALGMVGRLIVEE